MAKLYFYYSAMNAGKTTTLLQSAYNYDECGMKPIIFKPSLISGDFVRSRIGIESRSISFDDYFGFFEYIENLFQRHSSNCDSDRVTCAQPDCILVDEAQFLTKVQVLDLCKIVDLLSIPVLTYGLRTDFLSNTFTGSHYLLAWADEIEEIKTMCMHSTFSADECKCTKKATMNIRIDQDMKVLNGGEQVCIGGNEKYISLCRKHYMLCMKHY